MKQEDFMLLAIEEAYQGLKEGDGGPFGAVLVKNDKVVAKSHNKVLKTLDPTQHAEIRAIQEASKKLNAFDLSGCEIYTTTEPCPMCFSAIHWARIGKIYYGTTIEDVQKRGFNELAIPAKKMKREGFSNVEIIGPVLKEKCEELLKYWDALPNKQVY